FLVMWPHDEIMVKGHRISLHHVVRRYKDGMTGEQIAEWFPSLKPGLLRQVIDFYLAHQTEVDADVAEEEAGMDRNRAGAEKRRDVEQMRGRYAEKKQAERGWAMALRFLLDENLREALWHAIQHHNSLGVDVLDALRVGDAPAPPTGTADPDLLQWCEAN